MKNKTVNNKKLITSIISVVIIAGMAIQSFATNVDFEAFVKNHTHFLHSFYALLSPANSSLFGNSE